MMWEGPSKGSFHISFFWNWHWLRCQLSELGFCCKMEWHSVLQACCGGKRNKLPCGRTCSRPYCKTSALGDGHSLSRVDSGAGYVLEMVWLSPIQRVLCSPCLWYHFLPLNLTTMWPRSKEHYGVECKVRMGHSFCLVHLGHVLPCPLLSPEWPCATVEHPDLAEDLADVAVNC